MKTHPFGVSISLFKATKILFSGILLVSIVSGPIAPVFAREVSAPVPSEQTTETQVSESAPVNEQTAIAPSGETGKPEGKTDEITETATSDEIPVEETNSLTTDPALETDDGAIIGKQIPLSLDEMGSLSYTVDIVSPPGRNNLQSNLKLAYSSQAGENANILGYGWSTNIPYIERVNKKGFDTLFTDTYFTSSLSGELATTSATSTYVAKVDDGSYLQYTFNNNIWTVTDKQGTRYTFGTSTDSRIDHVTDTAKVYRWMLAEVRDTNDNYIRYAYSKDSGQLYPSSIVYTGNGSTDGIFEVSFSKELRSDFATSSKPGFPIVSKYRINEIQAKVNGDWVRKYVLAYTTGSNANRSLLNTITESGKDESANVLTLPATDFDYQNGPGGWTEDVGWTLPIYLNSYSRGVYVIDLNGDALPDVIRSLWAGALIQNVYLNDGDGTWTEETTNFQPPVRLDTEGIGLVDLNGDGRTDIYKSFDPGGGASTTNAVYLNTGTGWTLNASWTMPVYFPTNSIGYYIIDVNGDGLPDVVRSTDYGSGSSAQATYLNNGNGIWTESATWHVPEWLNKPGAGMADLNGDGLVDVYRKYDPGFNGDINNAIYLNNGNGWTLMPGWSMPMWMNSAGILVTDVNGDGLADVLRNVYSGSADIHTYINDGDGTWTDTTGWNAPLRTNEPGVGMGDMNGDGLVDIYRSSESGGTQIKAVHLNNAGKGDLLNRVTTSAGGVVTAAYKGTAEYRSGGVVANPELPFTLQAVDAVGLSDGLGTTATTSYAYAGGSYSFTNSTDRKLGGFATVTTTDPAGNVSKTFYYQGNTSNTSQGEYSDHVAKIGKVYRTEQYDNASNLYAKTITKWDKVTDGNRSFVKPLQTVSFSYDGDSDHKEKAESYSYENTYGNLVQKIEWGEVTGSDDGSFSDTGSDKASTTRTYAASSTGYLMLPSSERTDNQSGTKVRETRWYYDSQSLGNVTKGNQTKEERWKESSTYIDTEKTYNSYGLILTSKDGRDKTTTYAYDAYNLYPATVTDPLSHATAFTYDYSSGKVKQITDPNTRVFQTTYDAFDRSLEEKQPDIASPSTLVTKTAYVYTDTGGVPTRVKRTDYLNAATSTETYTYLDGFKRSIQERKQAEAAYAVKDFSYNNIGLLHKESLPYFGTGSTRTTATGNNLLYTNFSYDPLRRISTIADAVGTTTYAYDDWKTVVTDPKSIAKDLIKDAYGNLIQVVERNGGSSYTTNYEYDRNGNLTKITDASSNVRNFTYDGLNRRLTAEDLHASADGTYGTWTYTYDDAGNLSSRLDPKSQTVNYTYDDGNRLLTEDYTGTAGTEVTYTYDSGTDGIGRRSTASTTAVHTAYAYDPLGRTKTETRTIGGVSYATQYVQDRLGNLITVTYPDSAQTKYEYNSGNLLERIFKKEGTDGAFALLVEDFDYAPHGAVAYQKNANGTETWNTYDPNERYRLINKTTVAPDNAGNLLMSEDDPMLNLSSAELLATDAAYQDEEGNTVLREAVEKKEKRTSNSTTYLLGYTEDGKSINRTRIYTGDLRYATSSELVDVESSLTDTTTGWEALHMPKPVAFGSKATASFLTVGSVHVSASSARSVTGKKATTGEWAGKRITYPGAFGNGADLVVTANDSMVMKEVVLASKAAAKADSDGYYRLAFELAAENALDLRVQGKLLSATGTITASSSAEIITADGSSLYILPPIARDSSGRFDTIPVDMRYEYVNGTIRLTKLIPASWLSKAVYPVRTDATVSFTPGSGDGAVASSDDISGGRTWANVRANTTGGYASYTDTTMRDSGHGRSAGILKYNEGWSIVRGFIPVDTSSIPDAAIITGATLNLYGSAKQDEGGFSTAYEHYLLVQGTPSSNTALVNADFDNIGSTAWSSTVSHDSITTTGYNAFVLNDAGKNGINKTGYTALALRHGNDFNNSDPGTGSQAVLFKSTEASGTTTDPYLEVTYTESTAPSAPSVLHVEGQVNPTAVTDSSPEFSAIFNDADAGDTSAAYRIQVATTSAFTNLLWDSAKTTVGTPVTNGNRIADISYGGSPLSLDGATYYWRIKFWDDDDLEGSWSTTTSTFVMQTASGPTGLYTGCVEAQTGTANPTGLTCGAPYFTALFDDGDTGSVKTAVKYRIQVATTSAFTSTVWDNGGSGTVLGPVADGARTPDIAYRGEPLSFATTTYYWRIKFWNYEGTEGAWSTAATFGTAGKTALQNLSYTYDKNDNLTSFIDGSNTNAAKRLTYGYDDLNRLTSASSTNAATSTNYLETYTYDAIGNITAKTGQGSYTYAGTSYANPHAATAIGGASLTYDNNGNLTGDGTATYTWDYENRLTQSTRNSLSVTYAYDHDEERVRQANATTTTVYPSRYYSVVSTVNGPTTTATSTSYVWIGDALAAYVEQALINGTATGTPQTHYVHGDHLGSTNVVTDTSGNVEILRDYLPYGSERISSGNASLARTYIGEFADTSGLQYLNARYMDPTRGQFLSQDPVHLVIGNSVAVQQLTGQSLNKYLSDPQQLNSYSYARNNPIINKDPTGNATYVSNSGAGLSGIDSWNRNTYHEYQDQQTLSSNASYGQSNRWNLGAFYNQVKPGGPWDYKRNSEGRGFYFFNGKLVTAEEFGNLNYGYSGTAFGFGESILTDAAGAAQIATAGRDNRGPTLSNISGNFDDPRDTATIRSGVATYNNAGLSNNSTVHAVTSDVAYNATLRGFSRALSAISAVVKTLEQKIR
jgi:RHS repeat-associated protein